MTKSLLFTNCHFPTMFQLEGDSLLLESGSIRFVGTLNEARKKAPAKTEEIDLAGRTVMPGFCDFHLHLANTAEQLDSVDCETNSLDECLRRVAAKAKITPSGEWIIGYGWNQNAWQPAEYGTATQLDNISRDHPVLLHAKSLHAAWVNTLGLRIAGIDHQTPDPQGGVILRNSKGDPTGILLENAAFAINNFLPEPTVDQSARKILRAQTYLHSLGITAVHDFDRFECAEALLLLTERDQLRLRVTKNLPSEQVRYVLEENWRGRLNKPPFLKPGWLKAFADGALGPQSAAMLEPYEGSQNTGMLLLEAEEIVGLGEKAAEAGWPLTVHAIGDRAVREVLDGYTMLRASEQKHGRHSLPHRIEHVQIIKTDDLRRMKALDVIASVQPIHAPSDMFTAVNHWGKRTVGAYAYQSMLSSGITTRFGSDAPVESPNPFLGIHAAVTRQRLAGQPIGGWHPEQKVPLKAAIDAYAQPILSKTRLNLLTEGMPADLVVLENDLFELEPSTLADVKPVMTVVAGEIVFSR
ncbi:MAG: amidohydrolase [Chloroflexi bacterium]|nr:amidohydrolase [Chloroflexota bacterium]